ncbi:growth arrest-specific protein 6-like isoform X2 [Limulus polyphemus]|nr:growth arrest-specific protein 6-like isoform X2 [Limulus polyphemus]
MDEYKKVAEECRIDNGNCDHTCKTSPKGLECECRKGWRLDTDQRSCVDINECQENANCGAAKCFEMPGSYSCRCPEHEYMIAKEHTETGGNIQFSIR